MATKIRYLGVAAFEITNSDGVVVLVDPYIDENVASPIKTSDLKRVDLILVTHGAVPITWGTQQSYPRGSTHPSFAAQM